MSTKEITVSELRANIRLVLSEVQYGRIEYVIDKFGEPAAVIINVDAYRLLQLMRNETEEADDEGDSPSA